jgi:hypothetical protein
LTEKLLQFIWNFQYFNSIQLRTCSGEELAILQHGTINHDQGPDFLQAMVTISRTTWAGTIELHLKTSDWIRHHHQHDGNYRNVILHVVWENDEQVNDIPVLELCNRVPKVLLSRYNRLMESISFIPCENLLDNFPDILMTSWKERLLMERMLRKSKVVELFLKQSNFHWEEACWWLLARNFGIRVNADAFEAIARTLPVRMLAKQRNQIHQIESLLMGQAGLLEKDFAEAYPNLLKKEYRHLQHKLGISPVSNPLHFLRMRPHNFPTVRLAQLSMLIHHSSHLFARWKEITELKEIRKLFDITANDYWHYHFRLDELSVFRKKNLGSTMVDNIIVNTVAPILFAYGNYHHEQSFIDKAVKWLQEISAEGNSITKGFRRLKIAVNSAFDSQAMIELKTMYCDQKRCLECGIGFHILRTAENRSSV